MGHPDTRQPSAPCEHRLLALALGRRLEAAQQRLEDAEAALRHLGRCPAGERVRWLARAQADIEDVRRLIAR